MTHRQNSPSQSEIKNLIEYFQKGYYDDAQNIAEKIKIALN